MIILLKISSWVCQWKYFEDRSIFGEIMDNNMTAFIALQDRWRYKSTFYLLTSLISERWRCISLIDGFSVGLTDAINCPERHLSAMSYYDIVYYCRCSRRWPAWPHRQSLRSAVTSCLIVPSVRLSTVINRAFPVVAARTWNDLPSDVTSAESLSTFPPPSVFEVISRIFPGFQLIFLDIS